MFQEVLTRVGFGAFLFLFLVFSFKAQAGLGPRQKSVIIDHYVRSGVSGGIPIYDTSKLPEEPLRKYKLWAKLGGDKNLPFIFEIHASAIGSNGRVKKYLTTAIFWRSDSSTALLSVYDSVGDFIFNGRIVTGVKGTHIDRRSNIWPELTQEEFDFIKSQLENPEVRGKLVFTDLSLDQISSSARAKYYYWLNHMREQGIKNPMYLRVQRAKLGSFDLIFITYSEPQSPSFVSVYTADGFFLANRTEGTDAQKWTYCRHSLSKVAAGRPRL